jgi:hypothetical protein
MAVSEAWRLTALEDETVKRKRLLALPVFDMAAMKERLSNEMVTQSHEPPRVQGHGNGVKREVVAHLKADLGTPLGP